MNVRDSPTEPAEGIFVKRPSSLARTAAGVPSGGSPDGTGESAVLSDLDPRASHLWDEPFSLLGCADRESLGPGPISLGIRRRAIALAVERDLRLNGSPLMTRNHANR